MGYWKQGTMLPELTFPPSITLAISNNPQASHEAQGETQIHPKTGPKLFILLVLLLRF